jgi:hypothetical protein
MLRGNRVSDLTPLCTHDALQIVDLSENRISDMDSLEILGTCDKLYSLCLRGNPMEKGLSAFARSNAGKGYREVVMYHIPNLKVLDGSHLQFILVDASFISESLAYLTAYVSEHELELATDLEIKPLSSVASSDPWLAPLGQRTPTGSLRQLSDDIDSVSSHLSDASSSLTQTGLSFAGAPSALLRGRKGRNPALFASVPLTSMNNSEVLKEIDEERKIGALANATLDVTKQVKKRRSKSKKQNLTSTSLDLLPSRSSRNLNNQSPSPTELMKQNELKQSKHDFDEGGEEEEYDPMMRGSGGLMEAWRASRPCSSNDALPKTRALDLTPTASWEISSPEVAQSPNTHKSRIGRDRGLLPAASLSFESEAMPHSAHTTSTYASVPAFLMFNNSPLKREEAEPSCDDIDISFKSVQRQFSGQHRRRKHRGRGWQNQLEFQEKLFVAPDVSAESWSLDKANGVLKPRYSSKEKIEEEEDSSSENEESQALTRANLKARAQAISDRPVSAQKPTRRSFLNLHSDSGEDEEEGNAVKEGTSSVTSSLAMALKQTSVKIEQDDDDDDARKAGASTANAAGQLGFDLQSSLMAIEQWTDISELSQRKQKKIQEAAQNKQREAALLAVKPSLLLAPPMSLTTPLALPAPETSDDVVRKSAVFRECHAAPNDETLLQLGEGSELSDEDLIEMLKLPPKHVPQLRTRDAFRSFFKGFSCERMRRLLVAACPDEKKVEKRFDLVKDLLQ